ncbi:MULTISPECIES: hypothetical protein [unclassified Wolbachia]|uniref:hypothetical protein n=1 Tax=unclassified Wolbachia TaxID=2640676 RepID=UPI001F37EBA4|nr:MULTISPECIES: hypothetical protein [unclassified Wolbachia]UJQ21099.1 hypothetical protein L2227_00490 [Wolbachia endosymbiont of Delia radicum]
MNLLYVTYYPKSDATKPTGIQVAHKQTSIESGYNISDEIAERLDPSGLCCIASYDGLKIKKIGNISSLLFWYL